MQGDELLLRRACKGDVQAFEELMQSHESRIYAIALRMMGNREDAQDCAQEAMVRIYRAMGSFKGQSALATWIYRITMNTCLDELRRRKARKVTSLDSLVDTGWSPTDTGDTPEEHGLRVEKQNALNQAIQSLPDDMRAAIILRDVKGYSYDEIASILDANVGTIKSRISRGREKLREILSKQSELFGRTAVK
ncbi:MAG: sigma-70 family RNA polymerase sigma factor [Candidatus Fimadaptatus sp.]|nr:sigma-70 family RNA polymerase sigma factor [Candidatus Fimadaptatus sp.]